MKEMGWKDCFAGAVAQCLPIRVVYWATIRAFADYTIHHAPHKEVPGAMAMDVVEYLSDRVKGG